LAIQETKMEVISQKKNYIVFGEVRNVIGLTFPPLAIVAVFFRFGGNQLLLLIFLLSVKVMWVCVWIGGVLKHIFL